MGFFSRKSAAKKTAAPPLAPASDAPQGVSKERRRTPAPPSGPPDPHNLSVPPDPIAPPNALVPSTLLVPQSAGLAVHPQQKRMSTVVDDAHFADFEKDDYDARSVLLGAGAAHGAVSLAGSDDDDDDDYEEHVHVVLERDRLHSVSQLSALMGYCGLGPLENREPLTRLANEALARTFSLLVDGLKIRRLSPTMRPADPCFHESVVGAHQLELITRLTASIHRFLDALKTDASPYDLVHDNNKTLLDRYGSVKDIIGRGAYGVTRIVDSDAGPGPRHGARRRTYAVKEIQRRPQMGARPAETRELYVERVISEFILSSALNNKHVVRTLDLMITLPERHRVLAGDLVDEVRICQVMDCTSGGDLFHYCKKSIACHEYLSIDEIDCMVKQITKGLWYIHSHGVAHCDLKLENILLENDPHTLRLVNGRKSCRLNLKISDFGKSSVVRTHWDRHEQLSTSGIPIGSAPYMAPEEHTNSHRGISLLKKDDWALGVIVLILFNIRRSFFYRSSGNQCQLPFHDSTADEADTKTYGAAYLWQTTEAKSLKMGKYKDPVFGEYVKNAMKAHYDSKTKEWSVQKCGKFIPIETMFDIPANFLDPKYTDDVEDFEAGDFDLRKYCTYKLLDINPAKRLDAGAFLRSDWLASAESCGD